MKGFFRSDSLGYTDPSFPPPSLHQTQTASLDVTQRLSVSDAFSAVYGGSASYDYAQSTNFTAVKERLNLRRFPFASVLTGNGSDHHPDGAVRLLLGLRGEPVLLPGRGSPPGTAVLGSGLGGERLPGSDAERALLVRPVRCRKPGAATGNLLEMVRSAGSWSLGGFP